MLFFVVFLCEWCWVPSGLAAPSAAVWLSCIAFVYDSSIFWWFVTLPPAFISFYFVPIC